MTSAISIALGGLQMTAAKATDAAHNVAHAGLPTSNSAHNPAVIPAVIIDTGKAQAPDILQGVSEFQEAARAHEAQIKVVQALNEIQQQLVEALGWVIPQNTNTVISTENQLTR